MKKFITISLLTLSLCMPLSVGAKAPEQETTTVQKSESQKTKVESSSQAQKSTTVQKSTSRATTRRQSTTVTTEKTTSSTITSTEPSTTTTASANNSILFGKNKMLSIAAWTLIGIGVLFVLIVVLGGKSRRNRRPFQKSTKRYKNRSKYNSYSDRYRSNIKRK